jgi:hypothetical protein
MPRIVPHLSTASRSSPERQHKIRLYPVATNRATPGRGFAGHYIIRRGPPHRSATKRCANLPRRRRPSIRYFREPPMRGELRISR